MKIFQSTLPARGATHVSCCITLSALDFNPRSPRGERREIVASDFSQIRFQSTLPARGATDDCTGYRADEEISIHAPREGSDLTGQTWSCQSRDFNPRSPRGERQCGKPTPKSCIRFQSTLPARGATFRQGHLDTLRRISIHAPREGSDNLFPFGHFAFLLFQSTLPARGATGDLRFVSLF